MERDAHITVLEQKAVEMLQIKPGHTVIDATFGGGGHTRRILEDLDTRGICLAVDVDETAFNSFQESYQSDNLILKQGNFRNIDSIAADADVLSADSILADLGWRQEQFSGGGKGFSFGADEPLVMTLGNPDFYPFTAGDIVNDWEEEVIADIIYGYGEDRAARRIAKAIVDARAKRSIDTAVALAEVVSSAVPSKSRTHPATKTFQALRIAVNEEFPALQEFITKSWSLLNPGGRLAIISFHSLEDRIVKFAFRDLAHDHDAIRVTKKPIVPDRDEIKVNPRARSAKLRVIQKND